MDGVAVGEHAEDERRVCSPGDYGLLPHDEPRLLRTAKGPPEHLLSVPNLPRLDHRADVAVVVPHGGITDDVDLLATLSKTVEETPPIRLVRISLPDFQFHAHRRKPALALQCLPEHF